MIDAGGCIYIYIFKICILSIPKAGGVVYTVYIIIYIYIFFFFWGRFLEYIYIYIHILYIPKCIGKENPNLDDANANGGAHILLANFPYL